MVGVTIVRATMARWLTVALVSTGLDVGLTGGGALAAEQTWSERLAQELQQRADTHFDADFSYAELDLNTLLGEISAREISLSSRVNELDAGLNQVLRAGRLLVRGDWLTQQRNHLQVDEVIVADAQLTIAYYGKGQSNLHALLTAAKQQQRLQRASTALVWSVQQAQLENVVVNLFDQGQPLLSVRIASLRLPELSADDTADTYIAKLLWPIVEQVMEQSLRGESDAVVDVAKLTGFIWREIR